MNPAIVIVGYNRVNTIERLMRSVVNAEYLVDDVTLIVSLDPSDKSNEIIETINKIGWTHGDFIINLNEERMGLKKHILKCGDLTQKYGAVIILEDDLYVSPNYYLYAKQMIEFYCDEERICGVSLYSHAWNGYANYFFMPQRNEYDVYLGQIGISWGQCWTNKHWKSFKKWYEKNKNIKEFKSNKLPASIDLWGDQSWAKYFYNYMVQEDKYYVIPYTALSTNFSEPGEHNNEISNSYQVMLLNSREKKYNIPTFDQAIKYDMFFERILTGKIINGILGEDICVNLNGLHVDCEGKKYLLTCNKYDGINYVASFGLRIRPIEENVLHNISGDDIFLYESKDLNNLEIMTYKRSSRARIKYEIYDNPKKRFEEFYG